MAFKRLRHREDRERFAAALERLGERPALRPLAALLRLFWRFLLRPIWRRRAAAVRALRAGAGVGRAAPAAALPRPAADCPAGSGIEFTTLVAIAAVSAYVFGAYTDVISDSPLLITPGDGAAQDIARDIQTGMLTSIAKVVTWFGQWPVAAVVLAAGSIALLIRRRHLETISLVVGFAISQAGVYITKAAVERPRPSDPLVDIGSGSSFPSGHAATAIAYVALAVVIARELRSQTARVAVITVGVRAGGRDRPFARLPADPLSERRDGRLGARRARLLASADASPLWSPICATMAARTASPRPRRSRSRAPAMDSETVTYMILTAAGGLGLGAFGCLIVAPALSAYGRIWEKAAAGVLTLFVLAAFAGTGITAGLVIVYYWDSIIGIFN